MFLAFNNLGHDISYDTLKTKVVIPDSASLQANENEKVELDTSKEAMDKLERSYQVIYSSSHYLKTTENIII